MKKAGKRIGAIFLGLLICLLVLEVSLRVVGVYYANKSESDTDETTDAKTGILSIGDSVTFGIGASFDKSYPAQLEEMLNSLEDGGKYNVINRGRPAQNSAQLLSRLEQQLEAFRPDIVTILIGAQNQANYYGYQDYLVRKGKKVSLLYRIHNILDHIRVYKFFRLLILHNTNTPENSLKQSPPGDIPQAQHPQNPNVTPECAAAVELKSIGEYDKALALILGVIEKKDVESECYQLAGSIFSEQGKCEEAIPMFKEGIERDPAQFRNYEGIGLCYGYSRDLESALTWFEKGFDAARNNTLYELSYVGISEAYKDSDNHVRGINFFRKEIERQPPRYDYIHALATDYLTLFENYSGDKGIYEWIRSDIESIIEMCRRFNAVPVLQNYPTEKLLAELYRSIAQENDVLFVEQNISFKPYTQGGRLNDDFFVPDGHPNEAGYRIMAENLFNVINSTTLMKPEQKQ